jgi:glycosyltransferase involved in cell wall biosynthesis
MKVLYVGHYKEYSGWGQAARDYILAMRHVGIDVIPRSINLGNSTAELSPEIIELESKSSRHCDVCIQHVLPHYMKYDSVFKKNIGLFVLETSNIKKTAWPHYINLMNQIWVPCNEMLKDLKCNGIKSPAFLVPHTFDTSVYNKSYDKLNLPTKNKFTFYTISEFSKRKNLSAIIKAFHTEFKPYEPVELVIKVNKFNVDQDVLIKELKNFCNKVKDNLKLYTDPTRYKPEILITKNISRHDILRLHKACDCFITSSYGDAWNIPAFEAMGMGNIVITSNTGGMSDYINSEHNGFLVNGRKEPVFGQHETFTEFGTAREQWFEISINDLMRKMRKVYELNVDHKNKIKTAAKLNAKEYDYSKIGLLIKELLQNV